MTEERIRVPKGQGDEIETPPWLFHYLNRIFRFDVDICATPDNTRLGRWYDDALAQPWGHRVGWMNPPYSNPGPFVSRAAAERDNGLTTVALLKGDASTVWWNRHVRDAGATLIWWPRRIRFYYKGRPTMDAANFPSVIALYLPLADGEPPPKSGEWFLP